MDNGLNPNTTQPSTTTQNEPDKTAKGSDKPISIQSDQDKNDCVTTSQSDGVVLPSSSEQNYTSSASDPENNAAVVPQSVVEAIVKQGFPALAKTTKPIPASVFSYRFASPTNNQTPYYISSDIVLSGGIAQQTRRRIVHNEVERRRKDKINGWISKLAEVIPGCLRGKQSKNIVLEKAVEYFSEVNGKLTLMEEYQQQNHNLALDNQTLKQKIEGLQKQNQELRELLQKNNITVPDSATHTTAGTQSVLSVTIINEQTPKSSGHLAASDNTNVTWMTSGKIPITSSSTSTISSAEVSQSFSQSVKEVLTSPCLSTAGSNISVTSSVPQPQPNYSLYTVSSIMNGLPQGVVSLVDSNVTQETTVTPVTLALAVDNATISNNDAPNIPAANKFGTQTLSSVCIPERVAVGVSPTSGAQGNNGVQTMYLASGGGILPQGRGTSAPQGLAQVVLCQAPKISTSGTQGTTSINVPKGTLMAPVVPQSSKTINLSHQTAPVVSNNSIIIQAQGPILTLGASAASSAPSVVSSSLATPLFSSTLQGINSTDASLGGTLLQPQGVVALNNYMTTIPPVVSSTNNPGLVAIAICQGASIATDNVCVLPSNVLQQGLVTLNTNTTPRVTSVPYVPQVLPEAAPKPSQLVTGNLTSGLVALNVPPKPVGVVTGTPNTLHQQPQSLVTLNVPHTALGIQVTRTTSAATSCGNAFVTTTTSSVNLTPSSRTAFVIVRSTQPQQTLNYTVSSSRALPQISNFNVGEVRNVTANCVSVVSTRTTPSAVVQPAVFQTPSTGVAHLGQTPFSCNATTTPSPSINPIVSHVQSINLTNNDNTNNAQRSYSSPLSKNTPSVASSQPASKLPKSGNTKKRPPSRSSGNSKSKKLKQTKPSHRGLSKANSSITNTSSTSHVLAGVENGTNEQQRNPNSMDICQHEDMLSIQNFSISSLIPSIDSQTSTAVSARASSPLNTRVNANGARTTGGSMTQAKSSQPSSNNQRLSHSIDSLTGRNSVVGPAQNQNTTQQQQQQQQQQQPQQTQPSILSFSAESLLGTGDDLVPNIPPITCGNVTSNNFNSQNTLTISAFQESATDGAMNQSFSNFSAEALISDSDLIGISNEPQSSRANCTHGTQSGKHTHNRTQMFSDFSAESLINSSDLGSGLSYAIDNLISRSDNNDNSIAMATVNPNLLHTSSSSILPDNMNQSMYSTTIPVTPVLKTSMYPSSTAMPAAPIIRNHTLTSAVDYQSTNNTSATDQTSYGTINLTFSKYGFSSPQKQQSYKPNGTVTFAYPTTSVTTSPTFLKHSVDSITASQHNSVSSSTGAFAFNSPITNSISCPTFNSLYFDQINLQQFPVSGNSYSNNINRNFQGPMGSFA